MTARGSDAAAPLLFTIGHSTHAIDDFVALLTGHRIELVVDVRRFPASRRLPQFAAQALEGALASHGIAYRWLESLGGRRRADPGSPNAGWRHAAFRGYADHLASEEFAGGWFELMMLAHGLRTVIMCSEVLWWRCHRRLVADVALASGIPVVHIAGTGRADPHRLTPPASLVRGRLTYPAEAEPPPG